MKHYLIVFKNNNIPDVKIVADNPQEAKTNAVILAKFGHENTRIIVKSIWLCTRI